MSVQHSAEIPQRTPLDQLIDAMNATPTKTELRSFWTKIAAAGINHEITPDEVDIASAALIARKQVLSERRRLAVVPEALVQNSVEVTESPEWTPTSVLGDTVDQQPRIPDAHEMQLPARDRE